MDTSFPDASGRSQADALASVAAADATSRASSAAGQSALRVKVDGMWNPAGLSRRSSRRV
jgi:hypothetical protein